MTPTPQGWLKSVLTASLSVLARADGAGRPVWVRATGRKVRVVVYDAKGNETECRDVRTACMLAAA